MISSSQSNNTAALGQLLNSTGIDVSNLSTCEVIDPTRAEAPWHNSTQAFPQVYDEKIYICLDGNCLCPTSAPNRCGYACYVKSQYTCNNGTLTSA